MLADDVLVRAKIQGVVEWWPAMLIRLESAPRDSIFLKLGEAEFVVEEAESIKIVVRLEETISPGAHDGGGSGEMGRDLVDVESLL